MPTLVEHLRQLLADSIPADAPPGIVQWAEAHPLAQLGVGGIRNLIYQCLYEPASDPQHRCVQAVMALTAVTYGASYLWQQIQDLHATQDPEEMGRSLNHELRGIRIIRLLLLERDEAPPSPLTMVLDTMTAFAQSPTEEDLDQLHRVLQMARLGPQLLLAHVYERLTKQLVGGDTLAAYRPHDYYFFILTQLWEYNDEGCHRLDLWSAHFDTDMMLLSKVPGDYGAIRDDYQRMVKRGDHQKQQKQASGAQWKKRLWTEDWYRQLYSCRRWHIIQYCNMLRQYRQRVPIDWQVPHRPLVETVLLEEAHLCRLESLSRTPTSSPQPKTVPPEEGHGRQLESPAPQVEALLTPERVQPQPPVQPEPVPPPPAPRPIMMAPPPGWAPPVLMAPLPQWVSPPPPAPTTGGAPPRRRSKLQITVSPNPN